MLQRLPFQTIGDVARHGLELYAYCSRCFATRRLDIEAKTALHERVIATTRFRCHHCGTPPAMPKVRPAELLRVGGPVTLAFLWCNSCLWEIDQAQLQVTLTFPVPGGFILFFHKGVWTFSHAAAAGMYGRFSSDPPLNSSADGMLTALWMRAASAEAVFDYVQAVTRLVDRLSLYALNSANFLDGEVLECDKQIRFIAALRLLFSDLLSLSQSVSAYGKVSFALSAVDKLANIIEGLAEGQIGERQAFKACFSTATARGLRWIAEKHSREATTASNLLQVHARHILKVQQDVRSQMAPESRNSEAERLKWLRSYRNLRHGPFLKGDQFSELFVVGKAWAPSDLLRAVTALVIGLAIDPDALVCLICAQAGSSPVR